MNKKPNIILLIADSLRWSDNLIDELKSIFGAGTLFNNAFSNFPGTEVSNISLLCSKVKWILFENGKFTHVGPSLKGTGYTNGKFMTIPNHNIEKKEAHKIYDKFEAVYDNPGVKNNNQRIIGMMDKIPLALAEDVNKYALNWISRIDNPLFLILNYFEPHYPYIYLENGNLKSSKLNRKEVWKLKFKKGKFNEKETERIKNAKKHYIKSYKYLFEEIKKLINNLKKKGLYENSIIIFLSDHGESFLDSPNKANIENIGHGGSLHNSVIQVPLFFKLPGDKEFKTNNSTVGVIDVAPTILDLINLHIPKNFEGKSLKKAVVSNSELSHDIFCEDDCGSREHQIYEQQLGLISGKCKLIVNNTKNKLIRGNELYNLKKDPEEKNNIITNKEALQPIKKTFQEYFRSMKKKNIIKMKFCSAKFRFNEIIRNFKNKTNKDEKQIKERLKALGYI